MYVGRGPPENCRGSGAPVQRTGGTGGSYGPGRNWRGNEMGREMLYDDLHGC